MASITLSGEYYFHQVNTIHLLHACEGNMKIYSPKSIIFPEGNAQGENDILVGE